MLEVRDLACERGDVRLFSGLEFSLGEGELLWVQGPNGSGKTSLLRLVAGLSRPAAGKIPRRGEPVAGSIPASFVWGSRVGMPIAMRHILQLPTTLSFGW